MYKIKVVLIAHFSSEEIRSHLKVKSCTFDKCIRFILHKKKTNYFETDFAPWIKNLIKEFEKRKNIEVHVIAPFENMDKKIEEFQINGVFYHFFSCRTIYFYMEYFMQKINNFFIPLKYSKNRKLINKIINQINPDLINLYGAENPYYASSVLDVKDIPIISTCQTIYNNPDRKKYEKVSPIRINFEKKIFEYVKYFGVSNSLYNDLIKQINPNAINLYHRFPSYEMPKIIQTEKKYDFVNFAAEHCEKKGTYDSILALAIVKKKYKNVTLNIVGKISNSVRSEALKLIDSYDLKGNVFFTGYFPNHKDLLNHVTKSKYALLPVHLDVISGTIIQSMMLGLPLVTNITDGTPTLNIKKECVLLSKINDINQMANDMIKLMESEDLANMLRTNSIEYCSENYNNTKIVDNIVDIYNAIIYQKGINNFLYNKNVN